MKKSKPSGGGGEEKPSTPPAPIARGHRQRGAGTVIVSKAPVVTDDGIVLKPHERLPFQLLQEFCQKEKKEKPKYFSSPPGHRFRVVIEDIKNHKNDLTFCPTQSFESDKVAKDFAALLALWHFQKSIPIERKLPEPYSTTWIQMLAAEKEEKEKKLPKKSSAEVLVERTKQVPPVPEDGGLKSEALGLKAEASKQKIVTVVAVPTVSPSLSDWLCESCGTQNFARLASGAMRTRCLKCQTPKSDSSVLVSQTASASAKGGLAPTSGKVVKAAPAAVLDLRSDRKYSSKGEEEKSRQEQIQLRKRKNSYFDAVRRANRPTKVFLSPKMKLLIETVLGIHSTVNGRELSSRSISLEQVLDSVEERGIFPAEEISVSVAEQWVLLSEIIVPRLQEQGFPAIAIAEAIDSLSKTHTNTTLISDIQEDTRGEVSQLERHKAVVQCVSEAALEHLCLHLDESLLPANMDGKSNESKPRLQVLSLKSSSAEEVEDVVSSSSVSPALARAMGAEVALCLVHRLMLYGFGSEAFDAVEVCVCNLRHRCGESLSASGGGVLALIEMQALTTLYLSYQVASKQKNY